MSILNQYEIFERERDEAKRLQKAPKLSKPFAELFWFAVDKHWADCIRTEIDKSGIAGGKCGAVIREQVNDALFGRQQQ